MEKVEKVKVEPKLFDLVNTTFGLRVQNIMNTSYRNYLNRNRFFVNDLGRNIILTLKINY